MAESAVYLEQMERDAFKSLEKFREATDRPLPGIFLSPCIIAMPYAEWNHWVTAARCSHICVGLENH